ncbi:MAG: molybdopterin-guanine dinucleotide biosynthesis protein B [Thiomonas sp. 20-64-9]|jgi:molybdopterin-guanine dinucleotide biosynthesis protein B|uniref:molybdopterin-guanine dinucleotide biosynthesis protein B n=1 Tax=unclassified Thiomonas TaxID=2625466 RepID=UPI000B1C275D|nr:MULTISPECIES: molybdopterin-guanine dinucleotide biosynthesis protein B [unclassified Thiomonas]OYV29662.1 MAG: molybdopterin-guanine dinucleotide biosynthesis protein B [Thiomonas sp. 20-64-9]OZB70976.1 MAG: molybdopterin-guanine dinucleotide biosynthesis protein B [Thiomonas sp. 13-64-67]
MKVVGFAGFSGSGKTTLVEALVKRFVQQGLRVSVLKHAHHRFEFDHPGKDTWRHREAGAFEVLAASDRLITLQRRLPEPRELGAHELLPMLDPAADWVFVEGFKQARLPKVEVWRASTGRPLCYPEDAQVLAIATDSPQQLPQPAPAAVLDINDPAAVADWLTDNAPKFEYLP